jgi:hypothetical protein
MQPCATCDSLMDSIRIDSPSRLGEVASSLLPYLRQGTLEQVSGDASLDEIAQGQWGDLVAMAFRCTTCGSLYELVVETYHGSGGAWRRASREDQET